MNKNQIKSLDHNKTANFWNNLDDKVQGEYSVNYLMQKKHELLAIHRFKRDINFIVSNLPLKKRRLLDLACGSGNYLRKLAPLFTYSEGIDNSKLFVKTARKRFAKTKTIKIRLENIINCKLLGKFDLIIIGEVFLYLDDIDLLNLLKKVRKHMNKNSVITLRESVINKHDIIHNRGEHKSIRRTLSHYKKLFKTSGLKIKKLESNYDYNYAWIAALPLNFFPFFLRSEKFINFYMNNPVTRFCFLRLPFLFFTFIKPNYISQYYFLLRKK